MSSAHEGGMSTLLMNQMHEKCINAAIVKIEALPTVADKVTKLRLEEMGK